MPVHRRTPQAQTDQPWWLDAIHNMQGGLGLSGNPLNPINGLESMLTERGHPKIAGGVDTVQQLLAMLFSGSPKPF